ncbi:MAG: hypothetical protein JNL94_05845 [Planctomycetes bacterium]|nr:hypothetical protein [Planctomycetota bacterium]
MRTSTAFFLVVFLVVMSSAERRHSVRQAVAGAAHHVERVLGGDGRRSCADSDSTQRGADGELAALSARENATAKTLRTVERGLKALDERIDRLECENDDELVSTVRLLKEQRSTLERERAELAVLKSRLAAERVRIETQIDLTGIRAERERTEQFLGTTTPSPMEQLANVRESR